MMGKTFYILAILALLIGLYNLLKMKRLSRKIEDAKDGVQNSIQWAKEDLRTDIAGLRKVIKILAEGGRVTADMVDEGKPYSDLSAAEASQYLSENSNAVVIDVRTPSEYLAGHIPEARLIPVDEIEYRAAEVPKEAKTIFVVCQGGGRSAAACEILSNLGYKNLVNIYNGMGAWPGKKEIGPTIKPPASTKSNA
jgi:rhodanese-related sulfurtransferase